MKKEKTHSTYVCNCANVWRLREHLQAAPICGVKYLHVTTGVPSQQYLPARAQACEGAADTDGSQRCVNVAFIVTKYLVPCGSDGRVHVPDVNLVEGGVRCQAVVMEPTCDGYCRVTVDSGVRKDCRVLWC